MKRLTVLLTVMLICVCLFLTACGFDFTEEDYESDYKIANRNVIIKIMAVKTAVNGSYTYTADTVKGIETIWSDRYSQSSEISVTVSLSITEGKAKVVHVAADGTVTTIVECTGESLQNSVNKTISVGKGNNCIKIVALNCKDLDLSLNVD